MTDLTEQEDVCIGSLGQQKVYLNWQYVKDICTKEVSETYEQTKRENTKLKELLKECRKILDYAKDFAYHNPCCKCIEKINQALGEDK